MTVTLKHPETGLEWETNHLPSRLLSLAVSSDYGGEIFTEDDSVNITAFERSLSGHWYDQFVQMYQDGKNLDAKVSELDDEIDQLLSRVTDRIRRKGEITKALSRLDRLENGELSPPNRDTLVDPAPMTETERKSLLKDIMGDLHAYPHLPPDQWQNIEAVRSVGERLLQTVQDELQELRLEYDFLAWRKALLEQAITNCKRYGDFRWWQEFRKDDESKISDRDIKRTVEIGRALIEKDKTVADFYSQKEEFKSWAGTVIGKKKSTAYDALKATDCYVKSNPGATAGLEKTIQNVKEFARAHESSIEDFED